jgi:hypothetical protein
MKQIGNSNEIVYQLQNEVSKICEDLWLENSICQDPSPASFCSLYLNPNLNSFGLSHNLLYSWVPCLREDSSPSAVSCWSKITYAYFQGYTSAEHGLLCLFPVITEDYSTVLSRNPLTRLHDIGFYQPRVLHLSQTPPGCTDSMSCATFKAFVEHQQEHWSLSLNIFLASY